MLYKLKFALKRLIHKKEVLFIEDIDLKDHIIKNEIFCSICGNKISDVNNIFKVEIKNKSINFICISCSLKGKK